MEHREGGEGVCGWRGGVWEWNGCGFGWVITYMRGWGGRGRGRMVHTDVGGVNRSQGV